VSWIELTDRIAEVSRSADETVIIAGRFWHRSPSDEDDLQMWNALEEIGLEIFETGQAEALAGLKWPSIEAANSVTEYPAIANRLGLLLEAVEVVGRSNNVVLACERDFKREHQA